ncbi:phosphoinositide-3-kinase, regulatory subunit 4 [Geobacteraceae bacterium]|nr:phosphoinositide-3-kinase, regulatory subunit 4 [Geobacteraceae bacterium]
MSRIFVSHSSKDHEIAKLFGEWLQGQGHTSYFLDFDPDKGIAPGKRWEDELYGHLRLCRAVIALLSPNWLESKWCFAEVTQARAAGKPVFLALIAPCPADGIFSDVQHVDLTMDPAEGFRRLARGLKEVGIEPGEAFEWDPSRPPYPGLLAFEENDAAIFFGRDRDIQKAIEVLDGLRRRGGPSFILCLGASGSGKSSLMRAGLIPRLRKYRETWLPIAPFRPQEDPLEELAIKLARAFEELGEQREWKSIYEQLFAPSTSRDWASTPDRQPLAGEGLKDLVRDLRVLAGQEEATVLLAIDQAEELFGSSDAQKTRAFLQCLRGALEASGHRLMTIATMRSDSLGSFQTHPDLQEFTYEPLVVDPIPLRDLPQIIEGPARLANITLEPGLVETFVQDATTSDALPLLAFTLRELYERYGQDGRLQFKEYEELGRLEGSVRRAADAVIERMSPSPEELAALRVAFVPAMVSVNEEGGFIRRRASWLDLPARAHKLLQQFIEARLLVSQTERGERVVEVAHEALLRSWPRLNGWLREDWSNLRILDDLRHASEEWQTHNREESWLVHHGERLAAVEEMLRLPRFGERVGQIAKDYLDACVGKRREEQEHAEREALAERKRLEAEAKATRTRITALALIAVISVGAAVYGWHKARVAREQRNNAVISQSKALSAVSRQQTDNGLATLGMLLALEALPKKDGNDRAFVPAAEASLLYALLAQRERHILRGHSDGVNKVQFSPKGSLVATASRDRTVRVWNVETGKAAITLKGHDGQVYGVDFSHDGRRLVTASSDKTARLWNAETGQSILTLQGHRDQVNWAEFSRDDRLVATASSDKTARLWNATTGESIVILEGHQGDVYQASFSPDGTRIVTASADRTARLWNVMTGKELATLKGHGHEVYRAAFSPDGRRIVTASWDQTAKLWDWFTGKIIATLTGHQGGIGHAVFSPDGKFAVTTSADSTARLWDGITGSAIAVLKGHQGQVYDAQFSPDGRWLVTAADDGTARLWDLASRETAVLFRGHIGRVWSALFSPDGRHVATASEDNSARIWDVSPYIIARHEGRVYRAIFSPDGRRLVTISDDKTARMWDATTGGTIAVLTGHEGAVGYAAFSPDGKRLVTTSTDTTARLWDTATARLLHTFKGHTGFINHAHFSPNGQQVVTSAADGTARVWDVVSGEPVTVLRSHQGDVNFAAFSHDGHRIATASKDGTARLWKAASGELIASLAGHRGPVVSVQFSSDDSRLITASWDRTARLWEGTSGKSLAILEGHTDAVLSVAFSPDNRFVVSASSDNTARIWDATGGKPLRVLQGHEGEVHDASFSSDGRLILTASGDGTARIWHTASGLSVATLRGHRDQVVSAAFAPGGRSVATASWDKTARVWELSVGTGDDWITYARDHVPRELSDDERRLYLEE